MSSYTEIIHHFTDMELIISFLCEMCNKYEKSCNIVTPHTTDMCSFKCEKHFLKAIIKKMVNNDPNEVKILKFRKLTEEFTTFEKLFYEHISSK